MKLIIAIALLGTSLFAGSLIDQAKASGLKAIPQDQKELFKLIDDPRNPITKDKVELGLKLYMDPRLSKSGLISCNFCHNLSEGGDDGVSAAIGHLWTANPHHLNSPTVYNAVFFSSQFWDGRDADLEAQAQGPIQAHPEMAATQDHVVKTVTSMPEYVVDFKKAYGPDVKITFKKVTDTIGNFERVLITPSAFDAFLAGNDKALTAAEKKGLQTFIDKGCVTCHTGIALGGTMNVINITGTYKHQKVGDFKGDANSMVKVPTLRNITQTAPYFHNGQIWSLTEAIIEMGRIQLGMKISTKEAQSIATFFNSLEGAKPNFTLPALPRSTATTPRPNAQ